jgi:hypothetical protein
MAAAHIPSIAAVSEDIFLPPMYVLRQRHVLAAFKGVPDNGCCVTLWIHSSTLGIAKEGFVVEGIERVCRILACGPEPHTDVAAAVLCAFIAKLKAYEPALVDAILGFISHPGNDEVHRVGDNAFMECRGLTEVVLPVSITHVDLSAFNGCTSLTSVTLPKSLTHVGVGAFGGCTSLTSVTLPDCSHTLARERSGCAPR